MQGIFGKQPLADYSYLLLIASNIGAVIMPWMIFYQQSAVVDKGLTIKDLNFARFDTGLGAVLTQGIMCAIIITTAATLFVHHIPVSDAAHAALAFQPLVGRFAGVTFGVGLIGASMLGAFVVSLATAWAFGEAFGWRCSLNDGLRAKRFTRALCRLRRRRRGDRVDSESAAHCRSRSTSKRSTASSCRSCSASCSCSSTTSA